MNALIFILLAYGITNIIIFGSIFEPLRRFLMSKNPKFLGKLFTCPLCLSTWVGMVLSIIFYFTNCSTPMFEYGVKSVLLRIFFDGCFTSGCVWIIHNLEEMFERVGQKS